MPTPIVLVVLGLLVGVLIALLDMDGRVKRAASVAAVILIVLGVLWVVLGFVGSL